MAPFNIRHLESLNGLLLKTMKVAGREYSVISRSLENRFNRGLETVTLFFDNEAKQFVNGSFKRVSIDKNGIRETWRQDIRGNSGYGTHMHKTQKMPPATREEIAKHLVTHTTTPATAKYYLRNRASEIDDFFSWGYDPYFGETFSSEQWVELGKKAQADLKKLQQ